jgi:hypothetical protein
MTKRPIRIQGLYEHYLPRTKGQLLEIHAGLFLTAPNHIFQLPDTPDYMQSTLESLTDQLHRGVDHVFCKDRHVEVRAKLHFVIHAAYIAFNEGRTDETRVNDARMICHQIEDLITATKP